MYHLELTTNAYELEQLVWCPQSTQHEKARKECCHLFTRMLYPTQSSVASKGLLSVGRTDRNSIFYEEFSTRNKGEKKFKVECEYRLGKYNSLFKKKM
jgi:hypothetical protein